MEPLFIDRLSLHVPGLSSAEAATLSRLVAKGLESLEPAQIRATPPGLRLDLEAKPGESVDALAARIVTAIAQALSRLA